MEKNIQRIEREAIETSINRGIDPNIIQKTSDFIRTNRLTKEEIDFLFNRKVTNVLGLEENFPVKILSKKLGAFESIVKYLKENKKYSLKKISELTGRNNKTIWATYNKAHKKYQKEYPSDINDTEFFVPLSILKDLTIKNPKLGFQEIISIYLKDKEKLDFRQISDILERNYRTVWTAYNKGRRKLARGSI